NESRRAVVAEELVDRAAPGEDVRVWNDRIRVIEEQIAGEHDVALGHADDHIRGGMAAVELENRREPTEIDSLRKIGCAQRHRWKRQRRVTDRADEPPHDLEVPRPPC